MPDKEIFTEVGNLVAGARRAFKRGYYVIDDAIYKKEQAKTILGVLKAQNQPFNGHRIKQVEGYIEYVNQKIKEDREILNEAIDGFMTSLNWIDANTTPEQRLQLFNVNPADAPQLGGDTSSISIIYLEKLSDSAENRHRGFTESVMTRASIDFFMNLLRTNAELEQKTNDFLFGKGGMFEFLPTYRVEGEKMVRNPPKLRLADECDKSAA